MNAHATLFDYADEARKRARRRDPRTSHVAAERAAEFASGHSKIILDRLKAIYPGGSTIEELADATNLTSVQIARRLPEIQTKGLAQTTSELRPLRSGTPGRVWCATNSIRSD